MRSRVRIGAVAAAGIAFVAGVSLTSRVGQPQLLGSHGSAAVASLVDATAPAPLNVSKPVDQPRDTADAAPLIDPPIVERPLPIVRQLPVRLPVAAPVVPPQPVPVPTVQMPIQAAPASAVVTDTPLPSIVQRVADDRALVEATLTRFRRAYNRLDARSAQAVYPAVNAPALARAFDGLESQSLEFNECEIDVRGELANATCRGTSRYVPKIGNRDPRVEPRVWDFTLRKDEGDWKIENARAGR